MACRLTGASIVMPSPSSRTVEVDARSEQVTVRDKDGASAISPRSSPALPRGRTHGSAFSTYDASLPVVGCRHTTSRRETIAQGE